MSNFQKLLITLGAVWLSLQTVVLFAWIFGKLNTGVIYGNGVLATIAMGMMISMGRALAALLGTVLVMRSVESPKPERWALIVALLYALMPTIRLLVQSHSRPRRWDLWLQGADVLWPALVAAAAAYAIGRMKRRAHTPQISA